MDRTLDEVTPDCAAKLGEETTTPAASLGLCVCVRACVRGSVRVCAWLVLHSQVLCWCFRCIDAVAIVVVGYAYCWASSVILLVCMLLAEDQGSGVP